MGLDWKMAFAGENILLYIICNAWSFGIMMGSELLDLIIERVAIVTGVVVVYSRRVYQELRIKDARDVSFKGLMLMLDKIDFIAIARILRQRLSTNLLNFRMQD
jgi:hypothetical protein